ncbi:MAG: peptide-N-glycosidase F-related protein [Myxococcota bacterium]
MTWITARDQLTLPLASALLLALSACGDDGGNADTNGASSTGTNTMASTGTPTPDPATTTTGEDATAEATADETGTDETTGGGNTNTFCEDEGLPVAPLADAEGTDWGQVAGTFAVETTFGPFDLAQEYSGCENYIFFNDVGDGTSNGLQDTMSEDLFLRSARNVHYFFLTSSGDAAAGAKNWQSIVGGALFNVPEADQAYWTERVHFVTDDPASIAGSVGAFVSANPNQAVFGIDRAQTWDNPGSTSDTTTGAFATTAGVLGYVARYYNFRYEQDQWVDSLDATEVPMIDNVEFTPDCVQGEECFDTQNGPFSNSNNWQPWPVEFPDAATMAGFDTMDLMITATCGPSSYADCGHWDYEAVVNLCENETCEGGNREVARWITPYSRPGRRRWVIDATPMLGMVADGGTHYFNFGMIWNMNPSVWDLRFMLRNEGRDDSSAEVVTAFSGNRGFNDTYNDAWETVEFTPPAGTTRVELVAIISGHGQDDGNCAEWCNHQHEFTVNGTDTHLREFPGQVIAQRCADAVDEGVVPGQWGNWTPGRAGWCPGQPVQPWRMDITDQVTIDAVNTLDYQGLYNNVPVTGNRGRIRLSSYVVFYQ